MPVLKHVPILAVCTALSGCFAPVSLETDPVEVQTRDGVVTCQLYSVNQVLWDRAIDVPKGMSVRDGDELCKQVGRDMAKAASPFSS